MIPYNNVKLGEIKVSQIIDTRGVAWDPFGLPDNMPMLNPISWNLRGEWEDGWHINSQCMFRIENNIIMEAYLLTKLDKNNGDVLATPFKL